MPRFYTYEYGWADVGRAVYVYRSQDGSIGLRVTHQCRDGVWADGYSRFFVWDDENGADYEWEGQARAALAPQGGKAFALGVVRTVPGRGASPA